MVDSLEYIRQALQKDGNARVNVIRWEKDAKTGYYNRPVTVLVTAKIALQELSKPLNKRSFVWKHIRPEGMSMDGNIAAPTGNRLNDPALIEQLKAELRAELLAEQAEEKPKRRRKTDEDSQIEATIIEEPQTDQL